MEAFEKIKNVENVVEISKKIEEKLAKVEEAIRYADRVSAKTEVVFSELSEKLAEIERQKGKIGRLDELTKELVKTLDEISLKIPKFAEKVEVAKLSEEIAGKIKPIDPGNIKKEIAAEINSRFSSLKEEIEKRLEEFDRSIKSLEGIAEKVESISLQIGDLSRMPEILSRVEILSTEIGDLRKRLEEMSFEEIRTSLEQRFEELKAEYERKFEDLSRMPEILSRVESLIEESSNALMREEEKSKENFAKISQLIQEMTKIVETQSKKIEDFHKSLITYFKLFNCVNRLQVLTKAGEIESALADLRKNVDSLKELGVFDKEIENFLMSTLLDFSKVWSVYDKDIAELYENEASKYSEETYSLEAKEATQ
jgi:chromosome segregation ATPase